jgi:predicted nucleotidyltransferase
METAIDIPQAAIKAFCQRHHIRRLALFGSVLRGDFGPGSDVDVLVEFEPGHIPGWGIVTIEDELGDLLGQPVDLRTPEELSRHWRQQVIDSAKVVHE